MPSTTGKISEGLSSKGFVAFILIFLFGLTTYTSKSTQLQPCGRLAAWPFLANFAARCFLYARANPGCDSFVS